MHSSPRIPTRLGRLAVVAILGARASFAQADDGRVVFQRLQQAMEQTDYRTTQTRRVRGQFLGTRGSAWIAASERLIHRGANSAHTEAFAMELLAFEAQASSEDTFQQRKAYYQVQAGYLFRQQSFRVHDAVIAAQQYALVPLPGNTTRAGRTCNRLAVISRVDDRPSWLLDIDAVTNVPLYCAQFAADHSLVGELEVTQVAYHAAAAIPVGDQWAWRTPNRVEEFATFEEARARESQVIALPVSSNDIGPGYVLGRVRLVTDSLTGQQSLVLWFHDGIDTLSVIQRDRPAIKGSNIARFYSDAGVSQCQFQYRRTEFLIAGRNHNIKHLARRLHEIAVHVL